MKICLAQIQAHKGNIEANIRRHLDCVDEAVRCGAGMIVFPELSLTGYEPSLAKQLAISPHDPRLDAFQHASDRFGMVIAVGAPVSLAAGVSIGMIILNSGRPRQTYHKHYLHDDEIPFFASGPVFSDLIAGGRVSLAICYEISIEKHQLNAFSRGAELYVASVAKSIRGLPTAMETMSSIARHHSKITMMVNTVGPADDFICGGMTSAWDRQGNIIGSLDATSEAILAIDAEGDSLSTEICHLN